jgi:DNA-binding Xre family transcriptional regulator
MFPGDSFARIPLGLALGWVRENQQPMRNDGKHSAALSLIKTAMIEKKMTQAELADSADIHEKTIQNLLSGRSVRDQTLFDVCMVLGLDFNKVRAAWGRDGAEPRDAPEPDGVEARAAPVYMGAYTRAGVDHYIGSYLTVRPSFTVPGAIMAYRTDIAWEDEWPSLVFQERDRPDKPFLHRGRLYIPASSMYVHLVSLTKGAMRMVMVSQLDPGGQMRGLVTTLAKQRAQLMPVSAPIVYLKRDDFAGAALGEITEGQPGHREYRQIIDDTVELGYARLVGR